MFVFFNTRRMHAVVFQSISSDLSMHDIGAVCKTVCYLNKTELNSMFKMTYFVITLSSSLKHSDNTLVHFNDNKVSMDSFSVLKPN